MSKASPDLTSKEDLESALPHAVQEELLRQPSYAATPGCASDPRRMDATAFSFACAESSTGEVRAFSKRHAPRRVWGISGEAMLPGLCELSLLVFIFALGFWLSFSSGSLVPRVEGRSGVDNPLVG